MVTDEDYSYIRFKIIKINPKYNELPRSRAARYQKEFLLNPMQSIDEFF